MTQPSRRTPEADALLRLVEAQAARRLQIAQVVLAAVRRAFGQLDDFYDPAQVDAFVEAMTSTVLNGRRMTASLTDAYLRQQLRTLGIPSPKVTVRPDPLPRGIPTGREYVRPVKTYRYARLQGLDELEAEERALRRAETIADTDLSLAARDASRDLLAAADKVKGWRRIIHPELRRNEAGELVPGTHPVCGLCVAASDRLYPSGQLMPIHERCYCTVAVVAEGRADPGRELTAEALAELYAVAGGTGKGQLARVRYVVQEHGELGPVLREAGDHFRDEDDVERDSAEPAA